MSSESSEQDRPIEIVSDEDWKERVKAEDAARDEELRSGDSAAAGESTPESAGSAAEARSEDPSNEAAGSTADEAKTGDSEQTASPDAEPESPVPELPPADFGTLVGMLSTQVMVTLGMIPHPSTGKPAVELATARHFIDLLGVLEEKTRGNLTSDESGQLESVLHQFRMVYVEQMKSSS